MKGQNNRKYAIYSRKSKFTGKGESIENQIELCRQHIKLHHENVSEEDILIFEDEGFSGGNINRPQFQAMMKQIRANQIGAVVCYRLDRISRNVGDFAKLKDEFDYYNVEFTSIRDDFDTTSPSGRAMMMMASVFAQLNGKPPQSVSGIICTSLPSPDGGSAAQRLPVIKVRRLSGALL